MLCYSPALCAKQLPKCRRDELCVRAEFVNHIRDSFSMLSIERLIDFVKKIKRRWIAFLDSENEGERDERFLPTGQLIHLSHFGSLAGKRNADTCKKNFFLCIKVVCKKIDLWQIFLKKDLTFKQNDYLHAKLISNFSTVPMQR